MSNVIMVTMSNVIMITMSNVIMVTMSNDMITLVEVEAEHSSGDWFRRTNSEIQQTWIFCWTKKSCIFFFPWKGFREMDNLGRSVEAGKVANKGGWNCLQIVTKPGEGNFIKRQKLLPSNPTWHSSGSRWAGWWRSWPSPARRRRGRCAGCSRVGESAGKT